MPFEQVAN